MEEKEKRFRTYYSIRLQFLNNIVNNNPYAEGSIKELKRIKAFVFDDFKPKEAKKK